MNKEPNNEKDITKDAFFDDMMNIEKDIYDEALKLVEKAMSLFNSKSYDGAIEILRQAIGLYQQINKEMEVNALRNKIAEIYVLKENELLEQQVISEESKVLTEKEKGTDHIEPQQIIKELKQPIQQEELISKSNALLKEAKAFIENKEFNIALEKYDEVIELFRNMKKEAEIDRVYQLIEQCYVAKAEYLRQIKMEETKEESQIETQEIGKKEGYPQDTEEQLKRQEVPIETEKFKAVEQKLKKDVEEEEFKNWVTEKADEASKLIRNYELEIKKKNFESEPPFKNAINIYESIRDKLLERGWNADIYINQIKMIQQKEAQDLKLRDIEFKKKQKDKIFLESLKFKPPDIESERLKSVEDKVIKELEDKEFESSITQLIEYADKLERDYDSIKKKAIREKKLLEIEAPFLEIIDIYGKIKNMLIEKGWLKQAEIHSSQIAVYREKCERDKILREIEAHKLQK